jgi:hypothetical protein
MVANCRSGVVECGSNRAHHMLISTVAHVALDALLLASAVVLAISAWTKRVGSGTAYSSRRTMANSATEISLATGRADPWVPTVENGR